jgi:hypothetical protein
MTDSDLHADPGTHPEKLGNRDRLVAAASVRAGFCLVVTATTVLTATALIQAPAIGTTGRVR